MLSAKNRQALFEMIEKYRINGDGTIDLHHILEPEGQMPALLPRIGLTMTLCDDMQQVKWYGRGPEENYPDQTIGRAIQRLKQSMGCLYC